MSDAWSEAMKYTRKETGNSWDDKHKVKRKLDLEKDETKLLMKCIGAYLKDLDTYGEQVKDTIGNNRLQEHKEFTESIKTKLKNFLSHLD